MKRRVLIILTIILIIVAVIIGIIIYKKNIYPKTRFVLDNENKFEVIMPSLVLNDGGSFTERYYQIDLNENTVIECVDKYDGRLDSKKRGYVYKGKVENIKTLTQTEKEELKAILFDYISKNSEIKPDEDTWNYYTLKQFNKEEVKIYDKDIKNKLIKLLKAE